MKRPLFLFLLLVFTSFGAAAQKNAPRARPKPAAPKPNANAAVVVDERLAVLRAAPGFSGRPVRRMRRGRRLAVLEARAVDGVTFYRVAASSRTNGWMQREAVAARYARGDDERLVRLVQSSTGFDQIERARLFLEIFPDSPLRPAVMLLFGDLMEETAARLTGEAARRLSRREMAASGAPLRSFYLNYPGLDRYGRLGIGFLFNDATRRYHYDGAVWRELVAKTPAANEAAEARKRLAALAAKMAAAG